MFSAASDTFSLLIRALKVQGRIDLLNRTQLTAYNNQTANLLVGTSVPYSTGSAITGTGIVSNGISYRDTGVLLNVSPQISPDGRVLMRVQPEVSKLSPTTINLGNGVLAPQFDVQSVQTTVAVNDGDTVIIGGLISKSDTKNENKIPWVGDLPYVGAAFRFRTQVKVKKELLVILTPRVIRSKADMDRVMFEESRRMDWIVGDVVKTHGTSGMEPIMPTPGGMDGHVPPSLGPGAPGWSTPPLPGPAAPGWSTPPLPGSAYPPPVYQAPLSGTGVAPPVDGGMLPPPRAVTPGPQGQAPMNLPQVPPQAAAPAAPRQEERQWTVMPNRQ